eukprot:358623-Chlamydomonas_euryale.AAC.1
MPLLPHFSPPPPPRLQAAGSACGCAGGSARAGGSTGSLQRRGRRRRRGATRDQRAVGRGAGEYPHLVAALGMLTPRGQLAARRAQAHTLCSHPVSTLGTRAWGAHTPWAARAHTLSQQLETERAATAAAASAGREELAGLRVRRVHTLSSTPCVGPRLGGSAEGKLHGRAMRVTV